jgi:hypothetical protein
MSEMALTADHLLVIGKGQLIADTSVDDFVRSSSQQSVHIRSVDSLNADSDVSRDARCLGDRYGTHTVFPAGTSTVAGMWSPCWRFESSPGSSKPAAPGAIGQRRQARTRPARNGFNQRVPTAKAPQESRSSEASYSSTVSIGTTSS